MKDFTLVGGTILAVGSIVGLRVLTHFLNVGKVSPFLPSAILAAILGLLGFQVIIFGLLADMLKTHRQLSEEILLRIRRFESENDKETRRGRGLWPPFKRRFYDRMGTDSLLGFSMMGCMDVFGRSCPMLREWIDNSTISLTIVRANRTTHFPKLYPEITVRNMGLGSRLSQRSSHFWSLARIIAGNGQWSRFP